MSLLRDAKTLGLYYGMGLLPTPLCSAIGARLARRRVPRRQKLAYARAAANIAWLKPELDEEGRAAMLDRAVDNMGRYAGELCRLSKFDDEGRTEVISVETVTRLIQAGQPVILAMLHVGNWEVSMSIGRLTGKPTAAIVQPPATAASRFIMERMRAYSKLRMLPPGPSSALEAIAILKRREAVLGMFMDAQMAQGRVIAPVFGREMPRKGHNMAHALRFAALTGAAIVPALTERLEGAHFRMTILPALDLPYEQGEGAMLDAGLPLLNSMAEDWILPRLDQWHMLFRLGIGEEGRF
ncbi:lysophospholipid acyltransferase family protein [Acetobacteraceae bacterium H6797]|nr:lysophospholipid acyltransferase family protein [Acetobacteraceae bacterium H6797]